MNNTLGINIAIIVVFFIFLIVLSSMMGYKGEAVKEFALFFLAIVVAIALLFGFIEISIWAATNNKVQALIIGLLIVGGIWCFIGMRKSEGELNGPVFVSFVFFAFAIVLAVCSPLLLD